MLPAYRANMELNQKGYQKTIVQQSIMIKKDLDTLLISYEAVAKAADI
jgi:hypothetical protein